MTQEHDSMSSGRSGDTGADLHSTQEALRRANARMDDMLDSLSDGFCAVDHDWRITYINGRALDMLAPPRRTRDELCGHDLWQAFSWLPGSQLEPVYREAMDRRTTAIREFFDPATQRWLEVRAHATPDGLTLTFQDINQRKADQQALVQGSNRLQVALAAGRLGDWRWDAASDRVVLGQRAAAIFGLPAETPMAWSDLRNRLDPAEREHVRSAVLHAFAGHSDLELECRLAGDAKESRWIALVGRADYADQARREGVLGMTGVVQDISARRGAEDTLRQSEEVLRALANTIPQLAWMAQGDGAIVWFNERWFDYTGTTPDQVVGDGWQDTVEPSVLPAVLDRWATTIRNGNPFEMEYPIRGADGTYRWFLTRVNPVRDRHGRVLRWFGTNTDVDQVKRAEQALRDESHVLELLNASGSALASTRDLRSLLQAATDAATGVAGARHGAFLYHGRDAGDGPLYTLYTVSGASPAEFAAFGEAGANGLFGPGLAVQPGTALVRSNDVGRDARFYPARPFSLPAGHPPVKSYMIVPVVAHSGEVLGTMFFGHPEPNVFTERTERIVSGIAAQAAVAIDNARLYEAARRAAEERKVLLESEREARAEAERTSQMKDEFLATLSHELRTPLSAILGWAQVLRRGGRDQNDFQKGLQTIERNARAQAQLIEDLLDMSRITSGKVLLDMQTVAPAGFIDAAVETVRPAADAKNIRIEKHYAAGTDTVAGDPARLQQVVWNLLSNAIKFTPRDGRVDIDVARNDASVAVTVRDNGAGIKSEFITHVFERFRQADASMTRRHGGLGLGLAIVKHLIEQHGGTVRAESAGENRGASFTIELPLGKPQAPAPASSARSARAAMILPASGAPTSPEPVSRDLSGIDVLVVDDDRDNRELIKRILGDCGATVRIAASAREALAEFKGNVPRLLITDLGMPEVDGFELLDWVRHLPREQGGHVPAIALTAFARSEDRLRALEAGFSAHISKPVEPSELIAMVGSLVAPAAALVNRPSTPNLGQNGVR